MKQNLSALFFGDFFLCSKAKEGALSHLISPSQRLNLLSSVLQWDEPSTEEVQTTENDKI